MNIEEKLIAEANKACTGNFNYPDYDPDDPITDLAGALTILVDSSLPWDSDIESADLYDFLNKTLK